MYNKIENLLKNFLIDTVIEKNLISSTILFGLPIEHYDIFCNFIDQIYLDEEDIREEMLKSNKIYNFFNSWYKIINSFLRVCNNKYKLIEFNKEIIKEIFNMYFDISDTKCIR